MTQRVILAVTNDLENDQRVNRAALALLAAGWQVTCVGRLLPQSGCFERPYRVRRFRLWFRRSAFFYLNYNARLLLYLFFARFDVVVANDADTLPACWLAARLRRRKLVFDSHELFSEVPELVGRPRVRRVWRAVEDRLVPRVDAALTVCQPIARHYLEAYGVRFSVVRNVPLPKPFVPAERHNPLVILYQGAVNRGRGVDLLLRAVALLPQARLVVAGRGDELDGMRHLARELGVSERAEFLGHVPYDRLHQVTRQASVGVSLEEDLGLNYRYALPNKIFDYIQARVPVVASPLPAMAQLVREYGVGEILAERTPQALAELLAEVARRGNQGHYDGNLAKAAEILNWENEKHVLLSIFDGFSSDRGRTAKAPGATTRLPVR